MSRLRRTQGHHWKLITATFAVLTLAGGLAVTTGWLTLSVAILLGILTLAVQWYCIDIPEVEDKDLHGGAQGGAANAPIADVDANTAEHKSGRPS